jgi:sortase A
MNPNQPKNKPEPAIDLIRAKLDALYSHEPNAHKELEEAAVAKHRSKHQRFIYELSTSGKSLADIQIEWHKYYQSLPDNEKHRVWQEFYNEYNVRKSADVPLRPEPKVVESQHPHHEQTARDLHQKITRQVRRQSSEESKHKQHLRSLMFGLTSGLVTVLILLFGFFNERFIAPFISPSRSVSNTPIILDDSAKVSKEPKVIIPKINVEIPVVYDEKSTRESDVQKALERGVLHYSTTANPGEKGNAVIFGHSSNNIFNSGKYKFAFVLLKELKEGDTFMLHRDGKRYVYKVFEKKIVNPTDTSVLNAHKGRAATATLITCDPPGTSLNRLVVVGEQISPNPGANAKSTAIQPTESTEVLPSNAPSLWSRFWSWISS